MWNIFRFQFGRLNHNMRTLVAKVNRFLRSNHTNSWMILCFLFILACLLQVTSIYNEHITKKKLVEPFLQHSNNIPLNIYYVKIHKTGSTTLQNIFYRLVYKYHVFEAMFDCPFGMTYPHPPYEWYLFSHPVGSNGQYNLLTHHTKLDDVYKNYMPWDTKIITMLRHPLDQMRSTISFFDLQKHNNLTQKENILDYFVENISNLKTNKSSFSCSPEVKYSLLYNPQCHHLGLQNQHESNHQNIMNFINSVDSKLSLVLILEKLEESLLLFKRLFGLGFKDILHFKLYTSNYFFKNKIQQEHNRREDLITKHQKWNTADYALYGFFLNKHDTITKLLGEDFQEELNFFKAIIHSVTKFCKNSCSVFNEIIKLPAKTIRKKLQAQKFVIGPSKWSSNFTVTHSDCLLMMFDTYFYDFAIKVKQWPEICKKSQWSDRKLPKLETDLYCKKSSYIVENFPVEIFSDSPYFIEEACLQHF